MDDQDIILILRLFHITFGVFWVGSVLNFALFIRPALIASGPEGGKFMNQLGKTAYPAMMALSGLITIIAGILLIWKLSAGFQPGWFRTAYSKVLTTGSALAIIAFIIGFAINRPTAERIGKISDAVARTAAPPTEEQSKELLALRNKMFKSTNVIAVLLTLAVISMAICRYVG